MMYIFFLSVFIGMFVHAADSVDALTLSKTPPVDIHVSEKKTVPISNVGSFKDNTPELLMVSSLEKRRQKHKHKHCFTKQVVPSEQIKQCVPEVEPPEEGPADDCIFEMEL